MNIAACLIVKDGADTIGDAIECVRPYVSEINVYDTGSTDGTLELLERLARQPGAPIHVERGEWRDDYAWARAQSFAMASRHTDWLLWLDDDDFLAGGSYLRYLDQLPASVDHVLIRRDMATATDRIAQTWTVRMTRPGACEWRNKIHEGLIPRNDLSFAAVIPDRIRTFHPRTDGAHHIDHVRSLRDADDASPWLLTYEAHRRAQEGDYEGAVKAYREYLSVSEGERTHGRLDMLLHLADVLMRIDPEAGFAAVEQRTRELEEWRADVADGKLEGLAALGPDWFATLDAWKRPRDRNAACPCGSGRKSKKCCADRVFAIPVAFAMADAA